MKPIRVLIVDDQPPARRRIMNLLREEPEVHVVAECADATEAASLLDRQDVDLIFLDVELPGPNGFQLLDGLTHRPFVVFVTGFENYAVEAFGVNALDYLLKPFENRRFFEALVRARQAIQLASKTERTTERNVSLQVKHRGRMLSIDAADLMWLEAAGNYVSLVLSGRKILYRSTLAEVERLLPANAFLRIHRSMLVGLRHTRRFHYQGDGRYRVIMVDGRRLVSSRSRKEAIDDYLDRIDQGDTVDREGSKV